MSGFGGVFEPLNADTLTDEQKAKALDSFMANETHACMDVSAEFLSKLLVHIRGVVLGIVGEEGDSQVHPGLSTSLYII